MSIVWLEIEYSQKDEAKSLGGRWCAKSKKWYCLSNNPAKQVSVELCSSVPNVDKLKALSELKEDEEEDEDKVYLYVPYDWRSVIKEEGAKFDKLTKQWYIYSSHPKCAQLKDEWDIFCFRSNAQGYERVYKSRSLAQLGRNSGNSSKV